MKSSQNSLCLIIGDAPCKDADLTEAISMVDDYDVCCVNRAGLWFPGDFEHWFSWHANMLIEDWSPQRKGPRLHSTYDYPGVELHTVTRRYGGSGMDAIQVMLDCLGYEKVLLVGMPMQGGYMHFMAHWHQLNDVKERIRSMSGDTKHKYGYPDREWLDGR